MKTIIDLGQGVQKHLAIEVVFENRLALVTPGGDMIECAAEPAMVWSYAGMR
jgi:hypothetical protein